MEIYLKKHLLNIWLPQPNFVYSRIIKTKEIKVMTKQEKEIIRQELMECVGHYVNDAQLEIYIEDLES